jgi:hypothetical protein
MLSIRKSSESSKLTSRLAERRNICLTANITRLLTDSKAFLSRSAPLILLSDVKPVNKRLSTDSKQKTARNPLKSVKSKQKSSETKMKPVLPTRLTLRRHMLNMAAGLLRLT